MGFFNRQVTSFSDLYYEYDRHDPEEFEKMIECVKATFSKTNDDNDDDEGEFPTLKKLDEELNKLLKNH